MWPFDHWQQGAEKYLKAGLAAFELPIPKTHDLLRLNRLSDFGTITRYPNESAILDEPKVHLASTASEKSEMGSEKNLFPRRDSLYQSMEAM